jgi:hypothetical protein
MGVEFDSIRFGDEVNPHVYLLWSSFFGRAGAYSALLVLSIVVVGCVLDAQIPNRFRKTIQGMLNRQSQTSWSAASNVPRWPMTDTTATTTISASTTRNAPVRGCSVPFVAFYHFDETGELISERVVMNIGALVASR